MKCSSKTLQNLTLIVFQHVNIDKGIHNSGKNKVARNEKRKNTMSVFIFQKYGKF